MVKEERRRNYSEESGKEEGNLKSPDCLVWWLTAGQLSRWKKSVSRITIIYNQHKQPENIGYKLMIIFETTITEWRLTAIR